MERREALKEKPIISGSLHCVNSQRHVVGQKRQSSQDLKSIETCEVRFNACLFMLFVAFLKLKANLLFI